MKLGDTPNPGSILLHRRESTPGPHYWGIETTQEDFVPLHARMSGMGEAELAVWCADIDRPPVRRRLHCCRDLFVPAAAQ